MLDIIWKKPVFPLSVEKPNVPVTVEVIKQRNPFGVMAPVFKHRRQKVDISPKGYPIFLTLFPAGSKKRLLFNKAIRIKKTYIRTALRDGKCIFCHSNIVYYEVSHPSVSGDVDIHGKPLTYTSRAFACEKCDDKIWNSLCLNCGADISNLFEPFLFCEKCTNDIDEAQMKNAYKNFCERNADELQARRKKWKESIEETFAKIPCSICGKPPEKGNIFCFEHAIMYRDYQHYLRMLDQQNKCHFCKKNMDNEPKDRPSKKFCAMCYDLRSKYPSKCHVCGGEMQNYYKGYRMRVRFDECINCVIKRADISSKTKRKR